MSDPRLAALETKLRAARTRLILDKPFIGALVMHLPLESAPWCETVATDARKFYFNPDYAQSLSLQQAQFVLAHEAMHCALGHFARRSHRLRQRWDVACDHAVNLLLIDEGLKPPPGALADPSFRGLSAEEIYPLIPTGTPEKTLDQHAYDPWPAGESAGSDGMQAPLAQGGRDARGEPQAQAASDAESWSDAAAHARHNPDNPGDGGPLSPPSLSAAEDLAQQWRVRLAAAAQRARHAGRLGESWQRALEQLIEPKLGWRALLARYLVSLARDDYSFQRPSRRESEALLPRLSSGEIDVFVVLDTSGSVGDRELEEFASEVDALKAQVRARVTLHACDHALAPHGPWVFQPWQPVQLPEHLSGGGGTDFAPAFDWIAREGLRPDVLLYFTDAEGEFPPLPPAYPVLWLVKGRAEVPWGERIQLN